MYIEGLSHKLFFIAMTLWKTIVIELTKKFVVSYVVGDLVLLN